MSRGPHAGVAPGLARVELRQQVEELALRRGQARRPRERRSSISADDTSPNREAEEEGVAAPVGAESSSSAMTRR